ncbi:MAG TPA: hypothetical protein VG711_11905, partial [Phycisphaerales bacterium]|nr:hypothetical protein [Phycisphaerales bacterium]
MLAFSFNNDPTFVGWLTFAGYVIAALICAHRAMHPIAPPHADARNLRRFWFILTATLILLGFNKQADLQTTL